MNYYLLETEKGNAIPYSINKNRAIDIRYINQDSSYKIPNCSVVEMEVPGEVFFPGVISAPMFMVDREFAEVIEMYVPETIFKTVYLLNKESGMNATYFLPILEEIACLSSETEKSRGGTELRRIVLKKDMITSKPIFRIAGFSHSYVIGRMDLIESVLRRGIKGIGIVEIDIV